MLECDKFHTKVKIICKDCLNKKMKYQFCENFFNENWLMKYECEQKKKTNTGTFSNGNFY